MGKRYTSEQFWQLYEALPQELKDALFAEETGDSIYQACQKNGAADKLNDVVDCVGQVLVGVLSPNGFREALENDATLLPGTAQKISQEISQKVFYPVKTALDKLYNINSDITAPETTEPTTPTEGSDNYRELAK